MLSMRASHLKLGFSLNFSSPVEYFALLLIVYVFSRTRTHTYIHTQMEEAERARVFLFCFLIIRLFSAFKMRSTRFNWKCQCSGSGKSK